MTTAAPVLNDDRLHDLLVKTSRTFALSIPVLPDPTRRDVTVAYLLFRVADTLEDAVAWPAGRKLEALAAFDGLLADPDDEAARRLSARWAAEPPIDHDGYVELLRELPGVIGAFRVLRPAARREIGRHVARTSERMASFVDGGGQGGPRLRSLDDLRRYCYAVAGIVGEMLTELFLLERPGLADAAPFLRDRAGRFGEALQLVNILRDADFDAVEGRRYLPDGVGRDRVFALAREDLGIAGAYVAGLLRAGAPRGIVQFTALPVLLAWATLKRVETDGPGSKLRREEVGDIVLRLADALDEGTESALGRAGLVVSDDRARAGAKDEE